MVSIKKIVTCCGMLVWCSTSIVVAQTENELNQRYCTSIGGTAETTHYYTDINYIKVDCETEQQVIEAGLDKRSSLDSIHQALFASLIVGKHPSIVLYDTDGTEGIYEYQMRILCEHHGITYHSVSADELPQ